MLDTSLRFNIPSDLAKGREVQARILREVERHHYCPDATFAIKLALEEALINAIKHGNCCDCSKRVHISASVTPDRTEITIEDEGPGFDRGCVPDPTSDENLHRVHGRGILLMEAYMDEIQWMHGGRRVHMIRRNSSKACPGA